MPSASSHASDEGARPNKRDDTPSPKGTSTPPSRQRLSAVLRIAWPVLLVFGLLTVVAGVVVSLEATVHREDLEQIALTHLVREEVTTVATHAREFKEVLPSNRQMVITEIERALTAARRANQGLVASSEELPEVLERHPHVDDVVLQLDLGIRAMEARLEELKEASGVDPEAAADAASALASSARQYLFILDSIDFHIARAAQANVMRVQVGEAGGIIVLGLLLTLLAVFLLRPSHKMIAHQISQLKQHRGMLAEATISAEKVAREREDLLYALSHDIRAPLHIILLNVEIARARRDGSNEQEVRRIQQSAQRVRDIVDDLLDERGRAAGQQLSEVDVPSLLEELAEIYQPQAREHGLQIDTAVEDALPLVLTDEAALRRVLDNLVTNAIKYSGHGEITLGAQVQAFEGERFVCIRVRDTGVGIPEEKLQDIFTPGRRLQDDGDGHGLGLAIARRLVSEQLYGELLVESTAGDGTTFSVVMPIAAAGGLAATQWRPDNFVEQLRKTDVFEDLVVLCAGEPELCEQLRCLGAQVVPVRHDDCDRLAHVAAKHHATQLIVFDADHQHDAGAMICHHARELGVSAVGVYSDATRIDRKELLNAGCDALLHKPLDLIDLVEWMARALSRQQLSAS